MRRTTFTTLAFIIGAILLLGSCSVKQVVNDAVAIAGSSNPSAALQSRLQKKVEQKANVYANDPSQIIKDVERAKSDFNKMMSFLMRAVGREWGGYSKEPTTSRYVKYVQNYKSRSTVDFDSGIVTVETLMDKDPEVHLKNAVVTTLLTPEDPRAVDLFSDRKVELSGTPFLSGLVEDQHGRAVNGPQTAEAYANYLVANRSGKRTINVGGKPKTVTYTAFRLVRDYMSRNAKKYEPLADKYAKRYGVSKSLVMAVMKTESNFNPYATSHVPAYGLMQLVPSSGGRDAYRTVKGKDTMPSKDYLYDPENNVELGSAYLKKLDESYFGKIANPISREYCVISGYNTGTGNVLRTFSKDRVAAVNAINASQPPQVYRKLKEELPYEETRRYLVKVLSARREFVKQ